jgi:protein-disulfide isomerase
MILDALRARTILAQMILAALVVSCGPPGPESPRTETIHESPGVSLEDLTRDERRLFYEVLNEELDPCGEAFSLAYSLARKKTCHKALPAARFVARQVAAGYGRDEIGDRYLARYGPAEASTIEAAASPARGPETAPITLVEFSDFQCPYCRQAAPELERLVDRRAPNVRLVFKHYPLSMHAHALDAARAAAAAAKQGKFWEMHDVLFSRQGDLERASLTRYAEEIGLDAERFATDFESAEVNAAVEADLELGRRLGVDATPTIFVNGRRFDDPIEGLGDWIDEELQAR